MRLKMQLEEKKNINDQASLTRDNLKTLNLEKGAR